MAAELIALMGESDSEDIYSLGKGNIRTGLAKLIKKGLNFIPWVGPVASAALPERMFTLPSRALKIPKRALTIPRASIKKVIPVASTPIVSKLSPPSPAINPIYLVGGAAALGAIILLSRRK